MPNERRNERSKLLSSWCNAISVSVIPLGVAGPVILSVYDWLKVIEPTKPLVNNWQLPACWFTVALFFHGLGHLFLEGIVENDEQ